MRKAGLIAASLLAATLASSPLLAQDQETTNPAPTDHSTMGGAAEPGKYRDMMKRHEELMGMLKDTMTILRNLKHSPTADQKKKLDAMIARMDEMMKEHEHMMKKMKEEWEKRKNAPMEKKGPTDQMEEKLDQQLKGY
jgi:hypothetical protein